MRRERDDRAVALDICEAARAVGRYLAGVDREAFVQDEKTQSAVILQILLIGEAAKKLSPTFRDRFPSVPWSEIMRMRDKLIHHYEGRDVELIWEVAQRDVPDLLLYLEAQSAAGD